MKNEELIERNLNALNGITADDFLPKQYFEAYKKDREKIINLIKTQKSYLEKYRKDYLNYFRKKEISGGTGDLWRLWMVAALIIIVYCFFHAPMSVIEDFATLKNLTILIGSVFIVPTILLREIIPTIISRRKYHKYLDNLTTKLEIIKNDKIEKDLMVESTKENDKKINDSFVKIMKDTIMKIKSLEYADKNKDLLKIKEISEEYFAILRKEIALDSTTINLTTNEDIIALQNKLIEIENDAIAKAKIESDESALASELGPLTTLDRSSVELDTYLDTYIDTNSLKRKLDK